MKMDWIRVMREKNKVCVDRLNGYSNGNDMGKSKAWYLRPHL